MPFETALLRMSASTWKPEIRKVGNGKGREAKGPTTGYYSYVLGWWLGAVFCAGYETGEALHAT